MTFDSTQLGEMRNALQIVNGHAELIRLDLAAGPELIRHRAIDVSVKMILNAVRRVADVLNSGGAQ